MNKKQKKAKKRKKKIIAQKQYRVENSKRFQLQVKCNNAWVAPKNVDKKTTTPEFFPNMTAVQSHLNLLDEIKKENSPVIEGRIINTKTGEEILHIEPFEPVEEMKEIV